MERWAPIGCLQQHCSADLDSCSQSRELVEAVREVGMLGLRYLIVSLLAAGAASVASASPFFCESGGAADALARLQVHERLVVVLTPDGRTPQVQGATSVALGRDVTIEAAADKLTQKQFLVVSRADYTTRRIDPTPAGIMNDQWCSSPPGSPPPPTLTDGPIDFRGDRNRNQPPPPPPPPNKGQPPPPPPNNAGNPPPVNANPPPPVNTPDSRPPLTQNPPPSLSLPPVAGPTPGGVVNRTVPETEFDVLGGNITLVGGGLSVRMSPDGKRYIVVDGGRIVLSPSASVKGPLHQGRPLNGVMAFDGSRIAFSNAANAPSSVLSGAIVFTNTTVDVELPPGEPLSLATPTPPLVAAAPSPGPGLTLPPTSPAAPPNGTIPSPDAKPLEQRPPPGFDQAVLTPPRAEPPPVPLSGRDFKPQYAEYEVLWYWMPFTGVTPALRSGWPDTTSPKIEPGVSAAPHAEAGEVAIFRVKALGPPSINGVTSNSWITYSCSDRLSEERTASTTGMNYYNADNMEVHTVIEVSPMLDQARKTCAARGQGVTTRIKSLTFSPSVSRPGAAMAFGLSMTVPW
jgi:hypothetical protein